MWHPLPLSAQAETAAYPSARGPLRAKASSDSLVTVLQPLNKFGLPDKDSDVPFSSPMYQTPRYPFVGSIAENDRE